MERCIASWFCLTLLCIAAALSPRHAGAADRIILRNLDVLSDRTVTSFDEDGVRLDDGSQLGWDVIESARIDPARQEAFDRMLKDLGGSLSRLRQRLRVGDYRDALSYAEPLFARYRGRDSSTAYMVFQAVMWGRLARGQRPAALEPYLLCYQLLRRQPKLADTLPGKRRLQFDVRTGLTAELPPIWFDRAAVEEQLPVVYQAIARLSRPRPPGVYVYYATMALTVGRDEQVDRVMKAIPNRPPELAELRVVIEAQREATRTGTGTATRRLEAEWSRYAADNQPLALYWLGVALLRRSATADSESAEELRSRGLLYLLRIPASYGQQQPDVAAAALHLAMITLAKIDDVRGSVALRNELLARYGRTWHARQARLAKDE